MRVKAEDQLQPYYLPRAESEFGSEYELAACISPSKGPERKTGWSESVFRAGTQNTQTGNTLVRNLGPRPSLLRSNLSDCIANRELLDKNRDRTWTQPTIGLSLSYWLTKYQSCFLTNPLGLWCSPQLQGPCASSSPWYKAQIIK